MRVSHLLGPILLLMANGASGAPVVETTEWTESYEVVSQAELFIDNIWGDVEVIRGSSDQIELSLRSIRRADDEENFEYSLEHIPLRIGKFGNTVAVKVGRDQDNWWNVRRCKGCALRLDLVVSVPVDATINVSTVNDGDVTVRGIRGDVTATNVNGSIFTSGLTSCQTIETVNGDIEADFQTSPANDCRLETLNGDIALKLSDGADADVEVDLVNGKIRSTVELTPQSVPARVEHTSESGKHRYTIEQSAGFRIGSGGKTLILKSLNGDVLVERS
ncbi:MAG: DUF4097 family beta strand repeat-containing protein [Pseudomonadota bacterium]